MTLGGGRWNEIIERNKQCDDSRHTKRRSSSRHGLHFNGAAHSTGMLIAAVSLKHLGCVSEADLGSVKSGAGYLSARTGIRRLPSECIYNEVWRRGISGRGRGGQSRWRRNTNQAAETPPSPHTGHSGFNSDLTLWYGQGQMSLSAAVNPDKATLLTHDSANREAFSVFKIKVK